VQHRPRQPTTESSLRILTTLLLALGLALLPAAATASPAVPDDGDDPTLVWSQLLPPLPSDDAADADRRCGRDGTVCLRRVERDLARLAEELGCDHRAVFATTYQLLTRELRQTIAADPDAFDDPAGVGLLAEVFHDMYERVLADHAAGLEVPPAWQVAFDAAAGDRSAGQDMLLAINAHVQRDMPIAIAQVGLVAPDGTSRKADQDRVNQVLRRAYDRIVPTVADRYDPAMEVVADQPTGADGTSATQMVAVWREGVWRNAERLGRATSEAHRELILASIETNAWGWGAPIAAPTVPGYTEVRAEHCERHRALDGGAG
jgi:hypothetical protein